LQIITGFIGSTQNNATTTLGRGGSDLTASLVGAALAVDEIEIWTDVDGMLTADPRKVQKAFPIPEVTFEEAMELCHFGAKVIYPPTMHLVD
jgi:aspartokinase/homoserine dehydrogenase 1